MDTILTRKYPVSEQEFNEIAYEKVQPIIKSFFTDISNLISEIKILCSDKQSLFLAGRNMYLDTKLKILIPDLSSY